MDNLRLLIASTDSSTGRSLAREIGDGYLISETSLDGRLLDTVNDFRPSILLLLSDEPDAALTELVQSLRSDASLASMKIVILAKQCDSACRTGLYTNGADQVLDAGMDRDELRALLRRLARLRAESEIEDVKQQFRSLITHETSTPLNAISSFASIIAAEPALGDSTREMIAEIRHASLRMEEKIQRLLMLSELSSHPVYEYYPVYSRDIVSSLQQKLRTLSSRDYERVNFSPSAEARLNANLDLITVAAWNILDNALRYSPVDTSIQVTDRIEDDFYVLTITDEGPGIEAERMNTLFAEFHVENLLRHREGLGIGLSLCRRIVDLHRGEIVAENVAHGGASFGLRLPLQSAGEREP